MQTFLYVLGPFILYCLGGIAALVVACAIANSVIQSARLKRAQRGSIEELRSWSYDASCVLNDVIIKTETNPIMRDSLGNELRERLYELDSQAPSKHLERAKPRRRVSQRG